MPLSITSRPALDPPVRHWTASPASDFGAEPTRFAHEQDLVPGERRSFANEPSWFGTEQTLFGCKRRQFITAPRWFVAEQTVFAGKQTLFA